MYFLKNVFQWFINTCSVAIRNKLSKCLFISREFTTASRIISVKLTPTLLICIGWESNTVRCYKYTLQMFGYILLHYPRRSMRFLVVDTLQTLKRKSRLLKVLEVILLSIASCKLFKTRSSQLLYNVTEEQLKYLFLAFVRDSIWFDWFLLSFRKKKNSASFLYTWKEKTNLYPSKH